MTYREARKQFELEYWQALADKHDRSVRAIAAEAGLDRTSVYLKLHRAGVGLRISRYGNRGNWGDLTE